MKKTQSIINEISKREQDAATAAQVAQLAAKTATDAATAVASAAQAAAEVVATNKQAQAIMAVNIEYIKTDIIEIKGDIKDIKGEYVSRTEFHSEVDPLKKIIYSMIGLILVTVAVALLSLIIKK